MLESPESLKAFESKVGQKWAKEIIIDYYSRSPIVIMITILIPHHHVDQDRGGVAAGTNGEDPDNNGETESNARRTQSVNNLSFFSN